MPAVENPRGLFDRSAVGHVIPREDYPVESARIALFCNVIGETNPVHFDRKAALAAGYPDIVAPPVFAHVIDQETANIAMREGRETVLGVLGVDYRYLLHGAEAHRYFGFMVAGDLLGIDHKVVGFEDKKSGALEMAYVRTVITSPLRGKIVEINRTYIHRLP